MTWREIKKAVEQAGVGEDEEISLIQIGNGERDHLSHMVRLGKASKLAENISAEKSRKGDRLCAI